MKQREQKNYLRNACCPRTLVQAHICGGIWIGAREERAVKTHVSRTRSHVEVRQESVGKSPVDGGGENPGSELPASTWSPIWEWMRKQGELSTRLVEAKRGKAGRFACSTGNNTDAISA